MKKYIRFFESYNASFLLEAVYTYCYKDLNCISLRQNNTITIMFENLETNKCNSEANDLFKNDNNFIKYHNNFNRFLNNANTIMEECIKTKDLKKMILTFTEFINYYRWTEFFYVDYIYNELDSNKQKKLSSIKTKGRKFLNSFFDGDSSYLNLFYKQHKIDVWNLMVKEILNDKHILSKNTINKRNSNHLLYKNGRLYSENSKEYKCIKNTISNNSKILHGMVASKGNVKGQAYVLNIDFSNYDNLENEIDNIPNECILVTETTSPDIIRACYKAIGIITNQGGIASHAAIISRELQIPCIVGATNATKIIKTGDYVFMNGSTGDVTIG